MSAGRDQAVATTSATVTTMSDRRPSAVAASMPPSSGGEGRTDDESHGSTVDGRWRCASFETGVQVGGIVGAQIDIRRRTTAIDSHSDVGRDQVEQADRRYRGEPRRTSRTIGQHRHLPVADVTARCLLEHDTAHIDRPCVSHAPPRACGVQRV